MSQARKPNFFNQLLPFFVILLAVQLFFMRNQTPPDSRSTSQLLYAMETDSQKLDADMMGTGRALDSKASADLKSKVISQSDYDQIKLQSSLLTASQLLKYGVEKKDISHLENAFQTLDREWKSRRATPLWNEYVFNLPSGKTTADQLYQQTRNTLNEANKADYVYGMFQGYYLVDKLVKATGSVPGISYALAALILAICVRAVIFPLSQRQLMWGRQMSQLGPLIREIKEKYKDPQEQGLKSMELYKEYGINPYAGCLPALVQLPLFWTIYRCMLHYRFEFVKGTFLWINPAVAKHTVGWGFFATAANLGQEDKFLILIYGISMVISTMLTPVSDPSNAKQQRLMGISMSVMFAAMMFMGWFPVPAAFVLYWTFTNILATAQSLRAYRLPMPPLVKVNAANGGAIPTKKKTGWTDMMREMLEQKMQEAQEKSGANNPDASKTETKKPDDVQPYRVQNDKTISNALPKPNKAPKHKPKKRQ